jgi:putative nucleotidyltransferase with HDIG domain
MTDMLKLKQNCSTLNILYVEDDAKLRDIVADYLKMLFESVVCAEDGEIGLEKFQESEFDLILTDIQMPRMNGIEMIEAIKKIKPEQEVIILTAFSESVYFMDAIRLDVSGYLMKPVDFEMINQTLFRITQKIIAVKENQHYKIDLEKMIHEEVEKNNALEHEKIYNYEQTLLALVEMIERRDTYTGGHSERVAIYCKAIAKQAGCSQEDCDLIYRAGILHDIGKIVTPDAVLLKPGKLEENEYKLIQEHVTAGKEMLEKIPMYQELSIIVGSHHERYDGHGYPQRLKDEEIPFLSRIMIIADAFDAMTTNRIYKTRLGKEEALKEIRDKSGTQFDPALTEFAIQALQEIDTDIYTTQMPFGDIEKERFAYFYRDQITGAFNQSYLDLLLLQNQSSLKYNFLYLVNLHKFSAYNQKNSWQKGDELLKAIATYLQSYCENSLIFRFEGDDFVILSEEEIELPISAVDEQLQSYDATLFSSIQTLNIKEKELYSILDLKRSK